MPSPSSSKTTQHTQRTASPTGRKSKKKGKKGPDYCRVLADFVVKLVLVLMARALVSEFRCSRWLDFNLSKFLNYAIDVEIDNRAHISLLTILGGGHRRIQQIHIRRTVLMHINLQYQNKSSKTL